MIKVVGIRFQRAGKIYYFDPLDYDLETAMHVIVELSLIHILSLSRLEQV